MLITFSGLDGAGKTTLIRALAAHLESTGRSVDVLTMYDDIGVFSHLRALRDRAKGIARRLTRRGPAPPPKLELDSRGNVVRADSWETRIVYQITRITFLRQVVYFIDVLLAARLLGRLRSRSNHVVLLDRYFYDSMVDIAGVKAGRWFYSVEDAQRVSPWRLRYIRFLLKLVPKPDLSVFVDVPAEVAISRKVEYPLEYLEARRVVYRRLFEEYVARPAIMANDNQQAAISTLFQLVSRSRDVRVA